MLSNAKQWIQGYTKLLKTAGPASSRLLCGPVRSPSTWSACLVWKSVRLSCCHLCYNWFPVSSSVLIDFINVIVKLVIKKVFFILRQLRYVHAYLQVDENSVSQNHCIWWEVLFQDISLFTQCISINTLIVLSCSMLFFFLSKLWSSPNI